jgi:hypothetical protein
MLMLPILLVSTISSKFSSCVIEIIQSANKTVFANSFSDADTIKIENNLFFEISGDNEEQFVL